jgi:cysteinyl-tRNA synthetase
MSKSAGNIFLLGEAIEAFGAEAVVRFLVSGHYRQPIAFGERELQQASAANERIREFFRSGHGELPGETAETVASREGAFLDALADDFNTPRAIAELSSLVTEARATPMPGAEKAVHRMLWLLGLESLATADDPDGVPAEASELLAERGTAREQKDWARADEIRDRLAELGYEVRDEAGGVRLVPRR